MVMPFQKDKLFLIVTLILHSYLIRNTTSNLFVPQVSCNATKNLFCYEGTVLFNHLSNTVKPSKTYKEFKNKCKMCFAHF